MRFVVLVCHPKGKIRKKDPVTVQTTKSIWKDKNLIHVYYLDRRFMIIESNNIDWKNLGILGINELDCE